MFGIVPGGDGAARAAWAEGAIARALLIDDTRRLADGTARVIAADEWGEIHASEVVGARHDEPTPLEMIDWARFIAIQCPECEGPEGEWRNV